MKAFPLRAARPERALRNALKRTAEHAARTTGPPTDVQLLGQVSSGQDWARIHAYWTRRASLTGSWPQRLRPGELILNLWPVPPGAVGLTTGIEAKPEKRQPRNLLSTPSLVSFDPTQRHVNSESALSQAIASWVDDVVIAHSEYPDGLLLAPPILEEWAPKGRLLRRVVLSFDLDWQLPAADGIVWPVP